tara:strand:+ start:4035 stop:4697 length:663 start_codon:yes stop_codon:yes gene_type:complete
MIRACLTLTSILLFSSAIGACTQTRYHSINAHEEMEMPFSRNVYFRIADAFYTDPPHCLIVMPTTDIEVPLDVVNIVEQALALHLSKKVARVIGPEDRRSAERKLALNVKNPLDRRYLARNERCQAYLAWQLKDYDDSYILVWSRKKIGLEVKLMLIENDTELWFASHTTYRSEGGLPLSLLSLPIAAAEATIFNQDAEQLTSMVNDAVRRLIVTLPDVS